MPPPVILSPSGLQRFGKQAASLLLLCSSPIFISFVQRVPGKVLKLATRIIYFFSCRPQADAAWLPVLPCSPAAPALQHNPCTRVCVCAGKANSLRLSAVTCSFPAPQAALPLWMSAPVRLPEPTLSSGVVAASPGLQPHRQDAEKGGLCWWLWESLGLRPWERCKWS